MKIISKFSVKGYFRMSLITEQLAFGRNDLNEIINRYISDNTINEIRIEKLGYASDNDIKIYNL
jgi:hypothetical protein